MKSKLAMAILICLVMVLALPGCARRGPVSMVRATLTAGGIETELKFYGDGDNHVPGLGGDLLFEFDGPVDLSSTPVGASFAYANRRRTAIRMAVRSELQHVAIVHDLKDSHGRFVLWPGQSFVLTRTPFPAITASLLSHPEVEIATEVNVNLAPGEVVRIQFAGAVDQQFVTRDLSSAMRYSRIGERGQTVDYKPAYTLRWVDDRTLHLSIDNLKYPWVSLYPRGLDMLRWHLTMVPWQQVAVLDRDGRTLSRHALPFGVSGVTEMYSDYGAVGLLRYSEPFWPSMGVTKYALTLGSGEFAEEGSFPMFSISGWRSRSLAARDRLGLTHPYLGSYGLSQGGRWLAVKAQNRVTIYDMTSADLRVLRTLAVSGIPDTDANAPGWLYWSHDDSKIFFDARTMNPGEEGVFMLDLATGEESLVAAGHHLLSISPYGNWLLTRSYDVENQYWLMDFSGAKTRLNAPGQTITLGSWVDGNRILLNRNKTDQERLFPADQRSYLYHINDGSFHFLAQGYGFDYDTRTGQFFILQPKL